MTRTPDALVSVVIPVYNAGGFLAPAIASVLAQTHREIEVLVVDDGSTDGAVEGARSKFDDPRVRWIRQANAGKSAAMNRALREMRGEYYLIQDADDLSHPRRVERLLAALQACPDVTAVFSGHDLILDGRHVAETFRGKSPDECRADIERMTMPAHDPTGMYRLADVRPYEYETALRIGQGYDYILRVGERHAMTVVPECLYSYRFDWASITRSDPERRQAMVREVLRRACERRGIDFDRWTAARGGNGRRESAASFRDNGIAAHFSRSAIDHRRVGSVGEAIRIGLRCARLHPLDPNYLRPLAIALYPFRHHKIHG